MEKKNEGSRLDPEQLKWDKAGPQQASERKGGAGGNYNEGPNAAVGDLETTSGGMRKVAHGSRSDSASSDKGISDDRGGPKSGSSAGSDPALSSNAIDSSEWNGGTPEQGPTSGGMGAAGGGHDTDETDVWNKK